MKWVKFAYLRFKSTKFESVILLKNVFSCGFPQELNWGPCAREVQVIITTVRLAAKFLA